MGICACLGLLRSVRVVMVIRVMKSVRNARFILNTRVIMAIWLFSLSKPTDWSEGRHRSMKSKSSTIIREKGG